MLLLYLQLVVYDSVQFAPKHELDGVCPGTGLDSPLKHILLYCSFCILFYITILYGFDGVWHGTVAVNYLNELKD